MLFLSHFHYVLVPGAVFSIIAAVYYWIPKWTGRMYNEKAGQWHFWLSAIFINLLFFPQHFAGLAGMQRRVPDYAVQFTDFSEASTIGAFGFFLAQLLFIFNMQIGRASCRERGCHSVEILLVAVSLKKKK